MRVILPSTKILNFTPNLEQCVERAGRIAYKSEDRITSTSAEKFIRTICKDKHESVLEHGSITVHITCDRGISHELVRHRIASFTQESTRYCNYTKEKFGNELTFIQPCFWLPGQAAYLVWEDVCRRAEEAYIQLVFAGFSAQEARSILPNSLKTEVIITANPREWRHIFELRCSKQAHPQMRQIMLPLRDQFIAEWPAIFGSLPGATNNKET